MPANRELAALLRDQADDAAHHRKALLCASVALAETKTVPAAVKVIEQWDGPAEIKDAAAGLLGQLTTDVPAPGAAAPEGTTP